MGAGKRHRQQAFPITRRALLAAAAAAALNGACGRRGPDPQTLPEEALVLHRESLVLDLHIDTLLWQRFLGYDPMERHEPMLPRAALGGHMDLPRAREGGLDAAVLGLVVAPRDERPEQLWALKLHARLESGAGIEQTLETLELLQRTAGQHPERLAFVTRGSDVRRAAAEGRFAALAGLEGAHGLEQRLENLRPAFARGLRMIGLVHFQASGAGFPMTEAAFDARGLTPFGFDLLAEMDSLGIVADLAHLNAPGVNDALAAMTRPFVVSHSACRALRDHPRNLTDDQLRRIADRGGVIGLAVGRSFLGPGGLGAFAAHAEHLARVAGPEALAIGSDWDGAIVPVPGLEDVRSLPFLTAALLERGWRPEPLRGLLGENALRVLTDVLG
jgi:membrane dipeptidase